MTHSQDISKDSWHAKLHCLEQVLDAVKEGILISDRSGTIIYYNKEMAKLDFLKQENVLGKKISEVYKVDEQGSEHAQVIRQGTSIKEGNRIYYTAEGTQIDLVYSTLPIYKDQEIIGVYSLCRNVSMLKDLLNKTLQVQQNTSARNELKEEKSNLYTFQDIIGNSQVLHDLISEAKRFAKSNSPMLIVGATGTGKELFAQSIHQYSTNGEAPFLAINCAAIPENLLEGLLFGTVKGAFTGASNTAGFFEQVGSGTLFLDEINSMPSSLQAKLLRVLQERKARRLGSTQEYSLTCRIISSTNQDPSLSLKNQLLRKDLYYRLSALTLTIPPLCERREDILPLITHFLHFYAKLYEKPLPRLGRDLLELLLRQPWPGNVRQLQHLIENILLRCDTKEIHFDDLPITLQQTFENIDSASFSSIPSENLHSRLAAYEKEILCDVLAKFNGNISRSAAYLGIHRQNLQYKIKKYQL